MKASALFDSTLALLALLYGTQAAPQDIDPIKSYQKTTSTLQGCPDVKGENCTKIEYQDSIINWGNREPAEVIAGLLNSDGLCGKYELSCATDQAQKQTNSTTIIMIQNQEADYLFVDSPDNDGIGGKEVPSTITMTVASNYNTGSADIKELLVYILRGAIGARQQKRIAWVQDKGRISPKYRYQYDQWFAPNYAKVYFQPDDNPVGHFELELKIEAGKTSGGNCKTVTSTASAVVGGIAGFLGPFAVLASGLNIASTFACQAFGE